MSNVLSKESCADIEECDATCHKRFSAPAPAAVQASAPPKVFSCGIPKGLAAAASTAAAAAVPLAATALPHQLPETLDATTDAAIDAALDSPSATDCAINTAISKKSAFTIVDLTCYEDAAQLEPASSAAATDAADAALAGTSGLCEGEKSPGLASVPPKFNVVDLTTEKEEINKEFWQRRIFSPLNLGQKLGRKVTFPLHYINFLTSVDSLAASGLRWKADGTVNGKMSCVVCKAVVKWFRGMDANVAHRQVSPDCLWLKRLYSGKTMEVFFTDNLPRQFILLKSPYGVQLECMKCDYVDVIATVHFENAHLDVISLMKTMTHDTLYPNC